MRQSSWSLGIVVLAIVGLVAVGGTTVGGDSSLDIAASGLLALVALLYLAVRVASRQGLGRRLGAPARIGTQPTRVAGRRVF